MSGLLRNLLAILVGLLGYGSRAATDVTVTNFWVTPFDTGLRVLKSDKYLQFAETAQVDYLLRVGKFFAVLRGGASFVNVAQLVKFARPVAMFSRVRVATLLIHADTKCAYFSHTLHTHSGQAAEVLVKMKFKKGSITIPPSAFLPHSFRAMPEKVSSWESVLKVL
jgi:acyl-CoA thioesterase FadM